MSDFILFAFLFFVAYPVLTLMLMWQLRLYGLIGATVASVLSILIIAAAMVLSVSDIAGADDACDELFVIAHEEQDPDGNTWWSIRVTPYMQENGTDSMCERFGRCVLALIETSPAMGAIEIVNPENEWVPSRWRVIDPYKAMLLAGLDPYEELGHAYGYVEVYYDD